MNIFQDGIEALVNEHKNNTKQQREGKTNVQLKNKLKM